MTASTRAPERRRRRPARAALVVLLAGALFGTLAPADTGVRLAAATDDGSTAVSPTIRIVQANIKSGMGEAKTKADIRAVFRQKPDFVTYNEMTYRPDGWLVPAGYAMHRTSGPYTGETPVVWNTARWSMVDQGTFQISNRMRSAGSKKTFELGLRYANWVTVQSTTGQTLSVVSTHFAPEYGYTEGITAPSFRRLGVLVQELKARGPVLVGGDMNTNYKNSADYPRNTVASVGLTPTYDVAGAALPTGMYRNATIDYVFMAPVSSFTLQRQFVTTVNSDHRLLTADVALVGGSASAFVPGTITNDPATRPGAVIRLFIAALNKAPKGAAVHLMTRELRGGNIQRAIFRAKSRGVHVQILTASRRPTWIERRLARMLGTNVYKKSWIRHQPRWAARRLPPASVLVSASGGTRALRIDATRPLVPESRRLVTRARTTTDRPSYDLMFVRFFRAAGRKL